MNARFVTALIAAPVSAALTYVLLSMAASRGGADAAAHVPMFVSTLSVTGLFEVFLLIPAWYVLRCATLGARVALAIAGVGIWFVAASAFGFLLGHGGPVALRFGMALLLPGVVVSAVFAMLAPARAAARASIAVGRDAA